MNEKATAKWGQSKQNVAWLNAQGVVLIPWLWFWNLGSTSIFLYVAVLTTVSVLSILMSKENSNFPAPTDFDESTELDSKLEFRNAFSETLSQHGFPDTLVLGRDRANDVFHDRRLAIVDYLKTHDPASVRSLAKELDADKGVISRDLQKLAALDIIEFEKNGRSKAPRLKHRHVVVEPVF